MCVYACMHVLPVGKLAVSNESKTPSTPEMISLERIDTILIKKKKKEFKHIYPIEKICQNIH